MQSGCLLPRQVGARHSGGGERDGTSKQNRIIQLHLHRLKILSPPGSRLKAATYYSCMSAKEPLLVCLPASHGQPPGIPTTKTPTYHKENVSRNQMVPITLYMQVVRKPTSKLPIP